MDGELQGGFIKSTDILHLALSSQGLLVFTMLESSYVKAFS